MKNNPSKKIQKTFRIYKGEIYERWTHFPVWPNTNDIIRDEYLHWRGEWVPRPNLPLVSITYNIKGTGGNTPKITDQYYYLFRT